VIKLKHLTSDRKPVFMNSILSSQLQ